jgi:hypothetical protein
MAHSALAPTVDELNEQAAGPIYVRNTSTTGRPTGADIFITVYVGNQNRAHVINIPLSWKPFNLTEQAPRAAILGSQHFLRAINSGVLTLLNAEEARTELSTPRAAKETERLSQLQSAVEAAIRNPNADEFKLTLEGSEDDKEKPENKRVALNASFFDEGAVSTSFKAWVTKTNGMDVDAAINAAQVRGNFSTEELQYFAENTNHARIRNGLKKRLMAMAADSEVDE